MNAHLKKFWFFVFPLMTACTCGVNEPEDSNANSLLITNVQVVNFEHDTPLVTNNTSVLVKGDTIKFVGTVDEKNVPQNTRIIDGQGHSLIPGLVDMHVHVWDDAELGAYLARGITTVRNASGMPFHLDMARRIEIGSLAGPTLITTGPILNGKGPNTQINHQLVSNGEEARQAVRDQHRAGYKHLKVYSNLSRESYEAILEEARILGMTLMGHSPEGVRTDGIPKEKPFNVSFIELIDDQFVSFEHMETIVWHALYDEFDTEKTRVLARQIAEAGVSVDPALVAFRNLMRVAETKGAYLNRPGTEFLNPFITETEQENYRFWSEQSPSRLEPYNTFYLKALKLFHQEGVTLTTGSDAGIFTNIPGIALIEELKLVVEAGLTPFDALQAATINAAKTLQVDHVVGKIEAGYRADLVLVPPEALRNVTLLNKPVAVIKNGIWYDRSALDDLLNDATQTNYERTKNNVLSGLETQGSTF